MVEPSESISPSTGPQYELYQDLLSKGDQGSDINGSTVYQLEMRSALESLTSMTQSVQEQAKKNAKESGEQAPTIPTF